jgi:hypothetical protein
MDGFVHILLVIAGVALVLNLLRGGGSRATRAESGGSVCRRAPDPDRSVVDRKNRAGNVGCRYERNVSFMEKQMCCGRSFHLHYTGILSLTVSAALLLSGCEARTSSTPDTDAKIANAKEKISDAAEATTEAAKAKRDEYADEMSKRLDELNVKFEELKGRAAEAEGQAKGELEKKLGEAKIKRGKAAEKLNELKEASGDRWEKVKDGVGKALDDLKQSFE